MKSVKSEFDMRHLLSVLKIYKLNYHYCRHKSSSFTKEKAKFLRYLYVRDNKTYVRVCAIIYWLYNYKINKRRYTVYIIHTRIHAHILTHTCTHIDMHTKSCSFAYAHV